MLQVELSVLGGCMIEQTLKSLGLVDWEISFISRYSKGSIEAALRMAADHLLRNPEMSGRNTRQIKEAFASIGHSVE